MKICTFNANGIRAAERKGFWDWFECQNIDVLCLQETKAQLEKIKDIQWPAGYHLRYNDAQKPGYSGTALLSQASPLNTQTHFNHDLVDTEGRITLVEYPHIQIASVYFPSGTHSALRQNLKMTFLDFAMTSLFNETHQKPIIVCGDVNIAHQAIDLKNDKANEKNSGYLPEERQWMDQLLAGPWVDVHRSLIGPEAAYTWWTYRSKARQNNVGWRIDYCCISPDLRPNLEKAFIMPNVMGSDHCPVGVQLGL